MKKTYAIAAVLMLMMLASKPTFADFFDGARRTFQTDIPHFFQDDIPCAFGGQSTSHTKASCKSPDHPAKNPPIKADNRLAVPIDKSNKIHTMPPPAAPSPH